MHPYKTLNISPDSDSETIRQAYLNAVLLHPPESDPSGFKQVNNAYEEIKTEDLKYKSEIRVGFYKDFDFSSPKQAAIGFLKADIDPKPLSEEEFYTFLQS